MEKLIKKAALFVLVFTVLLISIFFLFDMGVFGDEVKIAGFYYIFMLVFLLASLWAYKNSGRFKDF
ncbi:hypothetical protein LAG90_16715 [Marinilongibacter aquaticus]|uniref:hypothetical protein n=1 Tax=Marinilongibacter aquaticus TaxID=2975157 RepID=UPI0021BDC895|nr:hypothetical protein [Marinilongibacter aquaticus]UBM58447.1 hypothetical protein LAG90_16715 [Marinilongibacter aquaticus]